MRHGAGNFLMELVEFFQNQRAISESVQIKDLFSVSAEVFKTSVNVFVSVVVFSVVLDFSTELLQNIGDQCGDCLLYTSPSPRDS